MLSKVSKSYRLLITLLGLSILLNLAIWIGVWRFFPQTNPSAVLHYSVGTGIDSIGDGSQIKVLPLVGLALLALNLGLGYGVARVAPLAAWIFWVSMPLMQTILLGAFIILWRVNN